MNKGISEELISEIDQIAKTLFNFEQSIQEMQEKLADIAEEIREEMEGGGN